MYIVYNTCLLLIKEFKMYNAFKIRIGQALCNFTHKSTHNLFININYVLLRYLSDFFYIVT